MIAQIAELNDEIDWWSVQILEKGDLKVVKLDISELKMIGKGNFGCVYLYNDSFGIEYVLKILDNEKFNLGNASI